MSQTAAVAQPSTPTAIIAVNGVRNFKYPPLSDRQIADHIQSVPAVRKTTQKKTVERFRCASTRDFYTAIDMLRFGYHYSIIPEQTALSAKQAKLLWAKFQGEYPDCNVQQPSTRNPTSLSIKNRSTKIHTSILMLAYRTGGHEIEITHTVDIQALNKAWMLYRKTVRHASSAPSKCAEININQAWGLAKMLTDGRACFEYCDHCDCWFFTSIEQQTTLHCPFCKD